jgi:hypothetical protein
VRIVFPITPSLALAGVSLLAAVGGALYAINGMAPSSAFLMLYYVGVTWALSWWVLADCRLRGIGTSVDHGWFAFQWWPILLPYHLLKTRGLQGCAFLAAFVGLFLVTWIVGIAVYLIGTILRG